MAIAIAVSLLTVCLTWFGHQAQAQSLPVNNPARIVKPLGGVANPTTNFFGWSSILFSAAKGHLRDNAGRAGPSK